MDADRTVIEHPRWAWALLWAAFPLGGACLYSVFKYVAERFAHFYWVPYPETVQLAVSAAEPYGTLIAVLGGAILGARKVYREVHKSLRVTLTNEIAEFKRGRQPVRGYPRVRVTGVFLDPYRLVLLSGSAELVREPCEHEETVLRPAFVRHGWPWLDDGDPFAESYVPWTHTDPALEPTADALLKTRAEAMSRKDWDTAIRLYDQLRETGVIVREVNGNQEWRRC